MKAEIQSKRNEFVQQFESTAGTIKALESRLAQERTRLEQLRGAVTALDTLEQSINAKIAAEAEKATLKAVESADESKEASDGQASA
jgi:recombinational DNA repair ATPase RecF